MPRKQIRKHEGYAIKNGQIVKVHSRGGDRIYFENGYSRKHMEIYASSKLAQVAQRKDKNSKKSNSKKSKPITQPKKVSEIKLKNLKVRKSCGTNWNVTENKLGEGAFSSVYVTCERNDDISPNCKYAVKIQKFKSEESKSEMFSEANIKKSFLKEVSLLSKLRGLGIVPMIYDAWICEDVGYMVIERLDAINKKNIKSYYDDMKIVMKRLHDHGIFMLDFHDDNFMLKNGRPVLIDLGLAEDYSGLSPGEKIHHAYATDYGDFTFEKAKEFDNLTVDRILGPLNVSRRATSKLSEMEK